MTDKEKILLVQLILEDIRGSWGDNDEDRIDEATDLLDEIYESTKDERYLTLKKTCQEYMKDSVRDGRYFRDSFPEGYEEMDSLHGLTKTIIDKSDEFKKEIWIFDYPENRFEDWEGWDALEFERRMSEYEG